MESRINMYKNTPLAKLFKDFMLSCMLVLTCQYAVVRDRLGSQMLKIIEEPYICLSRKPFQKALSEMKRRDGLSKRCEVNTYIEHLYLTESKGRYL